MNRETWLNELANKMAPRFADLGYPIPAFRVSIGFTSGGKKSKAGAECWHNSVSGDGVFEIFIGCGEDNPMQVAAYLTHELCHAAAGFASGHTGEFAKLMKALGMMRPFTHSHAGPDFEAWVTPLLAALPALPHARLHFDHAKAGKEVPQDNNEGEGEEGEGESTGPKKQTTRLKKCTCSECGYNVRVTAKWLEIGPPHCPQHGAMTVEE
jgi:hypothetical protein